MDRAQTGAVKHLVQFSTGLSSAEVAWRLVDQHGPEAVVCMSADTLREDPDNWRFGEEVINRLGCEWIKLTDGRTPMQAGLDAKCIPNNRMAVCSQVLKREPLRRYMDANYDPEADLVYIGYDWSEPHRIASAQRFWAPWTMIPLLAEPPYPPDLQELFRSRGIEPPSLYKYNFPHANCGGICVRGGQESFRKAWLAFPGRYRSWEAEEEHSREVLGKDVAILRDRRKAVIAKHGTPQPIPMRVFREEIQRQADWIDPDDHGACGCDMDSEPIPLPPSNRVPKVERWDGTGWALVASESQEAA